MGEPPGFCVPTCRLRTYPTWPPKKTQLRVGFWTALVVSFLANPGSFEFCVPQTVFFFFLIIVSFVVFFDCRQPLCPSEWAGVFGGLRKAGFGHGRAISPGAWWSLALWPEGRASRAWKAEEVSCPWDPLVAWIHVVGMVFRVVSSWNGLPLADFAVVGMLFLWVFRLFGAAQFWWGAHPPQKKKRRR